MRKFLDGASITGNSIRVYPFGQMVIFVDIIDNDNPLGLLEIDCPEHDLTTVAISEPMRPKKTSWNCENRRQNCHAFQKGREHGRRQYHVDKTFFFAS
jgi:hypothetical protein